MCKPPLLCCDWTSASGKRVEDLQKGPSLLLYPQSEWACFLFCLSKLCVRPSVQRPWRIPVHKGRIALTTYTIQVSPVIVTPLSELIWLQGWGTLDPTNARNGPSLTSQTQNSRITFHQTPPPQSPTVSHSNNSNAKSNDHFSLNPTRKA